MDYFQNEYVISIVKYLLFPALAAICGAFINNYRERRSALIPQRMAVNKDQLELVYTPLMEIVIKIPPGKDRKTALQAKHDELLKERNMINLFDEDLLICGRKLESRYVDYIMRLRSHYNIAKKALGYPYDKTQILIRHRNAIFESANLFLWSSLIFFLILIIFSIITPLPDDNSKNIGITIIGLVLVVYIFVNSIALLNIALGWGFNKYWYSKFKTDSGEENKTVPKIKPRKRK